MTACFVSPSNGITNLAPNLNLPAPPPPSPPRGWCRLPPPLIRPCVGATLEKMGYLKLAQQADERVALEASGSDLRSLTTEEIQAHLSMLGTGVGSQRWAHFTALSGVALFLCCRSCRDFAWFWHAVNCSVLGGLLFFVFFFCVSFLAKFVVVFFFAVWGFCVSFRCVVCLNSFVVAFSKANSDHTTHNPGVRIPLHR